MSQQSLASKKITKRNVAQSSVIFSVVVAVITLGVIATVAYVDIKEEIETVSGEKTIVEMIAEQKVKSAEYKKQSALKLQAEDLVKVMDSRVKALEQLDEKMKNANEKFNFVTTQLRKQPAHAPTTLQKVTNPSQVKASQQALDYQQAMEALFAYYQAQQAHSSQQFSADGEAEFQVSWVFKARGKMSLEQQLQAALSSKQSFNWGAKQL